MKPLIFITSNFLPEELSHKSSLNYARAIDIAGGIPVILPYTKASFGSALRYASGIVFSGGGDISPEYLNEVPSPYIRDLCPFRDMYELKLAKLAFLYDIPMLGICRGIQVMAIAAGGKLCQHIEEKEVKHFQQIPRNLPSHEVCINKDSLLYNIIKKEYINVNSFHHQGVISPGYGGCVSAKAPDGVIEALEYKNKRFALGVQWHPEAMDLGKQEHFLIFSRLISEAKRRRKK